MFNLILKDSGTGTRKRTTTLALVSLFFLVQTAIQAMAALPAEAQEAKTLRVALLPIPDVLPYYVAETRNYFADRGLLVSAVPVAGPLERDQLMQSGQIDGMLTEIATTAVFNRHGTTLKVVATAREPQPGFSLFRILAAPGSGIAGPADLSGVPIGISKNTVIEYVTDRLLTAKGLPAEKVIKKSVPVIPERYQLLLQGQIKAATLPEPLANSAMAAGALAVVEDADDPRFSVSVLAFRLEALTKKPEQVKAFLTAWDRAAADINAAPETFRPLMLKRIRVPQNVQTTYPIPPFPRGRVPDATQWADVMDWMLAKGLLDAPVAYGASVTTGYLPEP
jgi:NitT/TauT family transport system substrate-binding protein